MKYSHSQVDKDNLQWFANDMSVASLTEVSLLAGSLRGVNPFAIEIVYPISVVAGRNRSGKSTILAMAACAFHNGEHGFKLPERKLPYYTFSDFFVQSSEEIPPEGIFIRYRIMHNSWRRSREVPTGVGNLYQERIKKKGGKWSNYGQRVNRNVVFFGVQRVVPPYEKTTSRTYKASFLDQNIKGWETNVKDTVGRILGTNYDSFKMKAFGKYRLCTVSANGTVYSGFNMGAGENALFEIFSTIYASPKGTLLVIDEIELGLHEDAQKRLIAELKEVCRARHIQVLCTTHSPAILDSLPPEARLYVESFPTSTVVTSGISSLNAAGKLSGENSRELDIYVEDDVAEAVVQAVLDNTVRKRTTIIPIGSPTPIVRQLAARYKDRRPSECIAVMDGDKAASAKSLIGQFLAALESSVDRQKESSWCEERICFLPGQTWPERWLMERLASQDKTELCQTWHVAPEELSAYIEEAKNSGRHNEFRSLAHNLSLAPAVVLQTAAQQVVKHGEEEFRQLTGIVAKYLC